MTDDFMQALFIGQTYIDVTFITDHMPTGDEKHVASAYAVSFGGNAVTAAFCCAKLGIAPDLEVGTLRRAFTIILPAAAPTILTGMRISIGIAWLVIVAAEMLTGGVGIGFWVWDEWNNLNVKHILIAILVIGVVGLALEWALIAIARRFTYSET